MGMERRQKRKEVEVPTDSLSDVAFLLIIFFILTTSIQRLAGFTTELPSGERNQVTQQTDKTPTVAINDGQIMLDDKAISLEELRKHLTGLKLETKSGGDRVILLDAEGTINYQQYFEVMACISSAGGVIGILSEEEGK